MQRLDLVHGHLAMALLRPGELFSAVEPLGLDGDHAEIAEVGAVPEDAVLEALEVVDELLDDMALLLGVLTEEVDDPLCVPSHLVDGRADLAVKRFDLLGEQLPLPGSEGRDDLIVVSDNSAHMEPYDVDSIFVFRVLHGDKWDTEPDPLPNVYFLVQLQELGRKVYLQEQGLLFPYDQEQLHPVLVGPSKHVLQMLLPVVVHLVHILLHRVLDQLELSVHLLKLASAHDVVGGCEEGVL
mmetsp:Transcript_1731/g.3666  ORF Transcript_1731/g.3666 Transcript_1731/m.3666 type:complete len:240 (+) Transcript_1731:3139-3858(+)